MWEKYEKFWILGILAVVIYYFYKKGHPASGVAPSAPADFSDFFADFGGSGSIVNPTTEPGTIRPAQSTSPVAFRPAQPSTVPVSQMVSAGQFTYSPAPPIMRYGPVLSRLA